LAERRVKAFIPPNPTSKRPHSYNPKGYKLPNLTECMFCQPDTTSRYLATILLAAAATWWISLSPEPTAPSRKPTLIKRSSLEGSGQLFESQLD
jgi:hypothetical protein